MIKEAIMELADGKDLSYAAAETAMSEIMRGEASEAGIAAYLMGMRVKGASVEEITASAAVMRRMSAGFRPPYGVMDIVGTGGDMAGTFNISTAAAFVAAAGGVRVAKHGNRSASSKCGAADVLEALGARLELDAGACARILDEQGICFLYAPVFHSSMRFAAPVRRELGIRTLFNILGPLANPAAADYQLLGVYDPDLIEPMARVLLNLGLKRGIVVHGRDGLDEATVTGETEICEAADGRLIRSVISPGQFGLRGGMSEALRGGEPKENAAILRAVLSGERGPKRDAVLLNAGLCLYMAAKAPDIGAGVRLAGELIDSGAAIEKLDGYIGATLC